MKNEKYEYIKEYMRKHKNIEVEDAVSTLSDYFNTLPARVKETQTHKNYYQILTQQILEAFDSIVEQIANMPGLKIEIGEPDQTAINEWAKRNILIMEGYLGTDKALKELREVRGYGDRKNNQNDRTI